MVGVGGVLARLMTKLPRMTLSKIWRSLLGSNFFDQKAFLKIIGRGPLEGGLRLRFTCGGDPLGYIAHLLDTPHQLQWQYRLDYIIFYLARRVYKSSSSL